jgi:uncharacterized protein YigA (DUF484 family)
VNHTMDEALVAKLKAYRQAEVANFEAKARQDAELHAELADIKRRVDHATELLKLAGGETIAESVAAPTAGPPIQLHPTPALTEGTRLAAAAYDVLMGAKQPMHYRELTRAMQDRGVVIGGRDPSNNVIASMSRDPRFYRPRRGTYFLRELAKGPIKHVGVRHQRGA